MKYTVEALKTIGCRIAARGGKDNLSDRQFGAFYNRTPEEVADLWEMCIPKIESATQPKHLFWALMYMKLYLPSDVMTILLDVSYPTWDKWVWIWIEAIATSHIDIIHWSRRFRNAPKDDVWCFVTVDGTDFRMGEPTPFSSKWKSHKAKGASIKYKVAVSIYSGDIVWIYGPHEGSKNDLTVFREQLQHMLEHEEMIEADAGYGAVGRAVGTDGIIRSKNDYLSIAEMMEKAEIRARHETVNRRFKVWQILKQEFRNNKKLHQYVFYAAAVMTQMSIDSGNVLFSVEPKLLRKPKGRYYI